MPGRRGIGIVQEVFDALILEEEADQPVGFGPIVTRRGRLGVHFGPAPNGCALGDRRWFADTTRVRLPTVEVRQ
jgi:hypothetical protein